MHELTKTKVNRWRKKPVEIEALQFDGTNEAEILDWCPAAEIRVKNGNAIYVKSREGVVRANPGDMVMKGVRGEFYVCEQDIFDETYEFVGG
ncbi:MAG: hypothetical protein AAF438_19780 [Pseudomonadota bacterium]